MSVSTKKLSERQKNILKYIEDYVDERGYPPSIREIGDQVGISSTSVVDYNLRVLEREGRIRRDREVSRGLELVGTPRSPTPGAAARRCASLLSAASPRACRSKPSKTRTM